MSFCFYFVFCVFKHMYWQHVGARFVLLQGHNSVTEQPQLYSMATVTPQSSAPPHHMCSTVSTTNNSQVDVACSAVAWVNTIPNTMPTYGEV